MFRFPLLQAGEHFPSAEHKLDKRKHFLSVLPLSSLVIPQFQMSMTSLLF